MTFNLPMEAITATLRDVATSEVAKIAAGTALGITLYVSTIKVRAYATDCVSSAWSWMRTPPTIDAQAAPATA